MNEPVPGGNFFDGSPKMMYIFGLVTGIAIVLLLNNFSVLNIGKASAADTSGTVAAAADNTVTAPAVKKTGTPPAVTSADHVRGDVAKAKVVIVEYSDYQCPFCGRHHPTMQQIMSTYGDKVAWVYRHFPLSFHPNAVPAANAAECANEQGKFWEFTDTMFANQDKENDAYYAQVAKDIGLNAEKFATCYSTKKYQSVIDNDYAGGQTAGVNGTPATFINGVMVTSSTGDSVGAAPFSVFQKIIDAELAK